MQSLRERRAEIAMEFRSEMHYLELIEQRMQAQENELLLRAALTKR
jgi:hypothetical protein